MCGWLTPSLARDVKSQERMRSRQKRVILRPSETWKRQTCGPNMQNSWYFREMPAYCAFSHENLLYVLTMGTLLTWKWDPTSIAGHPRARFVEAQEIKGRLYCYTVAYAYQDSGFVVSTCTCNWILISWLLGCHFITINNHNYWVLKRYKIQYSRPAIEGHCGEWPLTTLPYWVSEPWSC